MTIPIVCPHCNETFQLSPELVGKSMRCPNPDCREIFEVQSSRPRSKAPPPAATPIPAGSPQAGEVADFVPLFDGEEVEVDQADPAEPRPSTKSRPPRQPAARIPTAALLPDKGSKKHPVAPAVAPKEVDWSGNAPAPTSGPAGIDGSPLVEGDELDDDEPFIRRRRRGSHYKLILGLIVGAIALAGAITAIFIVRNIMIVEQTLVAEAKAAYDEGNFPAAKQKYDQLIKEYSGSSDLEEYKFYSDLSETRVTVGAVTARDNPVPSINSFETFVEKYGSSPFAQPEREAGNDIVETGQRVVDTIADHSSDKLEEFRKDRTKNDLLVAAEAAVTEGRRLLPIVDKFRGKDGISLEPQRKRFTEIQDMIVFEKHRLEVLAPFRDIAREPTSEIIGRFVAMLHENKLADDDEAKKMLAAAEKSLRQLMGMRLQNLPASPPPADTAPPVLFSAAVVGSPEPRPNPEIPTDVVFSTGRGVLYALDAYTGKLVWGTRVAVPNADPRSVDLPLRVSVGDGGTEWVLVVGEYAGVPGITARVAKTGEPVWYQPLTAGTSAVPTAALARPLVIGKYVYVPLRDAMGTVAEFELFTGARTGELTIRQPLGGGLAVLPGSTPGVSLLFVSGDAQRICVFEMGREDAAGRHLDPKLVRVLQTDHPRDSLRGEPVMITPLDPNGPRYLILSQADGPTGMKLRAFLLPMPDVLAADLGGTDPPTPLPAEVSVPGWAWFPPISDGERVVLTTDAGAFLPFGVNQIGNQDRPLFTLPGPRTSNDQDEVARSQVVAAEEDAYWVVLGGQLIRLRTAVDPAGGLRIVPQGSGRPVGEPVHRAQVRPALGLGVVVTRAGAGGNVQAVAFDLGTGQIRWQRRVGVTPAGPPVARDNGSWIVASNDGGVYAATPASKGESTPTASVVATVVAPPFAQLNGRAAIASSPDGKQIWILAAEKDAAGRRLRVRVVGDGALKEDAILPLPDDLAGIPLPFGDSLLLPLANGYIYRYSTGATELTAGPLWRGETTDADVVCHLGPSFAPDEFLATDGGRRLLRWKWPNLPGAKVENAGGPWEAKAKIVVAPTAIKVGDSTRLAAADSSGGVLLFDAEKPGDPIRRWFGTPEGPIPQGTPSGKMSVLTVGNRAMLAYAVDRRHLVALDPNKDEPVWVARDLASSDGALAGWVVDNGRVIATDQVGKVTVIDGTTGAVAAAIVPPPGSAVASGPLVPSGSSIGLLLLDDGSGTIVPLSQATAPMK